MNIDEIKMIVEQLSQPCDFQDTSEGRIWVYCYQHHAAAVPGEQRCRIGHAYDAGLAVQAARVAELETALSKALGDQHE